MDITPHVAQLRDELANAAELAGPEARALAERLVAPLEATFRLALLDALTTATDEITRDMAPGSVQLRLQGREPHFVVTLPPSDDADDAGDTGGAEGPAPVPPVDADGDGSLTRINLRLSEQLKSHVEAAAARDGLSVNAWLVRAATAGLHAGAAGHGRATSRPTRGGQRYTGWVR